jgi:hypothetical protein
MHKAITKTCLQAVRWLILPAWLKGERLWLNPGWIEVKALSG